MYVDIVCGLQRGDCAKGCVSKSVLEAFNHVNVCKVNGGGNAGHTVYHNNEKYVSHYLNSGIFSSQANIIIGPATVLHVERFLKEVEEFEKTFSIKRRLFIAENVHIVTDKHLEDDSRGSIIGTTKQGIGYAYSDKALRIGLRAKDIEELEKYVINKYRLNELIRKCPTLAEMSQGFWLDIDHGDYPYVTSSNCLPQHFFTTYGIPMNYCRKNIGVAKWYETYSGYATGLLVCDQSDEENIRIAGKEFGSTTGRARRIGYLDLDALSYAITCTGINVLVMKKFDVLENTKIFNIIVDNSLIKFKDAVGMKGYFYKHMNYKHQGLKIIESNNADGNDIDWS